MSISFHLCCVGFELVKALQVAHIFVRSGGIDLNYNFLRVFGRHGSNWSTTTSSYQINYIATAYRLSFTPADFNPSDNFNRAHGFPVRCLVY